MTLRIYEHMERAQDIEHAVEAALRDRGCPVGSLAQARILLMAGETPGMQPTQIALMLHRATHSVSGLLHRIDDNGLIERLRGREDRRNVFVHLTDVGRAAVPALTAVMHEVETQFFGEA